MAVVYKVGSYTLPRVQQWESGSPLRIPAITVPRRHGTLAEDGLLDKRIIRVRGIFKEASDTALRDAVNAMCAAIYGGPQNIYRNSDRYVVGQTQSFNHNAIIGTDGAVESYQITFECADPLVKNGTLNTPSQSITTNPQTFNVTNNGNAPADVKITINADAGGDVVNPKLMNQTSGKFWQYTGTISSGNTLIVDTSVFTVLANGTKDLANFSGEWWKTEGGVNSIKYDGAACSIDFEFRDTYWDF